MTGKLGDQQVGGADDGAEQSPPTYVVVVVVALFLATGIVGGYGGILLASDGNGPLAIGIGAVLLVAAFAALALAFAVIAYRVTLRRELRRTDGTD